MTEPASNEPEEILETEAPAAETDRQSLLTSIAAQLVKAREASGQSVEDVMRDLKLRRVYIESLESGDWDNMPGQVYALGFLRQYAAHLHIDLENEIDLLKDSRYRLTKPLTYPDPPIAPSRKWAITIGIAFVVLFILFNISSHDETREPVPPMEQPTAEPVPAPAAAVNGETPANDETPAQAMPSPTSAPESAAPETAVPAATAPAAASGPMHQIDLEAVDSEAWIEVYLTDASGTAAAEPYRQRLLQAGEHMLIDTTSQELQITCGNAASLQISVDGKLRVAAGSLGKAGKVIRYRLDTAGKTSDKVNDKATGNSTDEAVPAQNDLSD